MNSKTVIKLPDHIRNGRNPYRGEIKGWVDERDIERLVSYLQNHQNIETSGEENLDELLALVPLGKEIEALSFMYDDPNVTIED